MDVLNFIDEYTTALMMGEEEQLSKLEAYGADKTASLTDVAMAITNLMMGVHSQMMDVEQNNELNLNILIDALYKAELINDDVLGFIQESIEQVEENEEDGKE